MSKSDIKILKRGLKRMAVSLFTATTFAISVFGLIVVAFIPGYLAVFLFLVSLLGLGMAFILLYAQGISRKKINESKGEKK